MRFSPMAGALVTSLVAVPLHPGRVASQSSSATSRMWSDSTFATPFRDTLSVSERLGGLSLLWSEIRWGFPDFDDVPGLNWDSVYLAYIPRATRTSGTFPYYRLLQRFVAELHDGHTGVTPPPELRDRFARPPVTAGLVEGHVLVRRVDSPSLAGDVAVGDEIVAVDGIPVRRYAHLRVEPYENGATPQDQANRTYGRDLLRGPGDRPVELLLRGADGATRRVSVARSGYHDVHADPWVKDTVLTGNVGYLRVITFNRPEVPRLMRDAMRRLKDTRALVVDIRRNGGGSSTIGYSLLSILADRPFAGSSAWVAAVGSFDRTQGRPPRRTDFSAGRWPRDSDMHYDRPVAVLIGPATYSAAEDFTVAFVQMKRGVLVGEATGGSTGQPLAFPLPGGGTARVRTKHDTFADGREFVDIGIRPDIKAAPSVADVRGGRDAALVAALHYLAAGG